MTDMDAFDRQIANEVVRASARSRLVDDLAIFTAVTATQSAKGRFQSMFSATKFVVASVIVALFGGFLLAGILPPTPDRVAPPAAVGTGEPAPSTDPRPSASPQAPREVYEATARLIVDPGRDADAQDIALAEAALARYANLATSRPVAEVVIDELGLDVSPQSLLRRIATATTSDTLELSFTARDDDPEAARALALVFGNEIRVRVRDSSINAEVKAADAAIAANRQSVRLLQNRLDTLRRKPKKDELDRSEIISLTGQISSLQRDIQLLQPSSRAYVRNLLEWLERPIVPERPVQDGGPEMVVPTIDVVVATQGIERGAILEREMLTLRSVPMDETNEMYLTDIGPALGKVAAIDILKNQAISPNMFVAE